jgi:hypothetical protein
MATFHNEKPITTQPPLTMASSNSTLRPEPPSELPQMAKASTGHSEHHRMFGDVIRDVIIGFADGLTVPFALTAGLSSYV